MFRLRRYLLIPAIAVISGVCAAADATTPADWLNRMAEAMRTTNYEGTVIRSRGDVTEVLKVVRAVIDGTVREKIIVQEGEGLEIVRIGNEVHCILPDQKSVRVMEWNDKSSVFSTLPSSDVRFGSEYDVSIVRTERVAGRMAILVAIRPHDGFRFGHRIWIDIETGFPLQTRLIGDDGKWVELVKFADISLDREIHSSALAPSISTEDFRWFTDPKHSIVNSIDAGWVSTNLPAGFRAVSTHEEELPGSAEPVTHIVYNDGLASVSVFIEPTAIAKPVYSSQFGASSSYSVKVGEYRITAVGEVPAPTVEQIATSMRPN